MSIFSFIILAGFGFFFMWDKVLTQRALVEGFGEEKNPIQKWLWQKTGEAFYIPANTFILMFMFILAERAYTWVGELPMAIAYFVLTGLFAYVCHRNHKLYTKAKYDLE